MAELTEEQKAAKAAAKAAEAGADKIAADAAGEVAATKKRKYIALRPINHDHVLYPEGAEIKNLSDEDAEPLLMHRHIKPATKEVAL